MVILAGFTDAAVVTEGDSTRPVIEAPSATGSGVLAIALAAVDTASEDECVTAAGATVVVDVPLKVVVPPVVAE